MLQVEAQMLYPRSESYFAMNMTKHDKAGLKMGVTMKFAMNMRKLNLKQYLS